VDELTRHLPRRQGVDVAIITILREELRATLDVFGVEEQPHRGQPFYETSVPCRGRPERDLSIVLTAASKPLNVHIAQPVERLRDRFPPSAVFLVGIAGGRKGRVKHGDVVVSRRIHYYPPGRLTRDGLAPRPEVAEPHDEYGNGLYSYDPARTAFFQRITDFASALPPERRPSALPDDFRPEVHHPATIAAGEVVMRDGAMLAELAGRDDAIRAVDQESYGFASSVRDLPWAVFRGVSDLSDRRQDDRWKYASAAFAALCLRDFLENYFVPSDVADL
jgi:nucleoside phosphorylase